MTSMTSALAYAATLDAEWDRLDPQWLTLSDAEAERHRRHEALSEAGVDTPYVANLRRVVRAAERATIAANPRDVDKPGAHDPGGLHGWLETLVEQAKAGQRAAAEWEGVVRRVMGDEQVSV